MAANRTPKAPSRRLLTLVLLLVAVAAAWWPAGGGFKGRGYDLRDRLDALRFGVVAATMLALPGLLLIQFAGWLVGWPSNRAAASRLHRRATRICVGCGYDLRATPDRCPECGLSQVDGGPTPEP